MEHMGIRGFSIINHPAIGVPPIWEILIWLVVTGTMEFVWLSIYIYMYWECHFIPTDFHSIIFQSYTTNQSTSHNPGFAKSNPLFFTMLQRCSTVFNHQAVSFPNHPRRWRYSGCELCWWINPGATLLFLHLVTPGYGSELKAIDWCIFRIW